MPRKISIQFEFWMVLMAGLTLALLPVAGQAPSFPDFRHLPPGAYRPGRIIVFPKAGREAELKRFHETRGSVIRRQYSLLRRMQVIDLPAGAETLPAVEAYQRSGLVESADPDITFRLAMIPNDPAVLNGLQWPLLNTGQSGGVPDADIDAPEAWDRFNTASNVIVAVIDSGVRYTHQDLAANMWVNPGEIPRNGLDDDDNGFIDDLHGINSAANTGEPIDEIGHGTHVAGIVGAVGNNGVGTCGVAWRTRIMACRFLNPGQDGTLADLSEAVHYALGHGAKVMNWSFTTSIYSPGLSNLLLSVRDAGVIVAAAAGNHGSDIYPGSIKLDNIVSVTGTTSRDTLSGFNTGVDSVHLGAPGTDVYSTYNRSDTDYEYQSGTSMASPHVAGALALLRARYPQLTHQQIITRLLASVDPLPSLAGRCITGGRLNLDLAVGAPDYRSSSAPFAWVPTNGMTSLMLAHDGVSAPLALSFSFPYYGRPETHVQVSANGLAGFASSGLTQSVNTTLPSAAAPNGAIYPYWDDLNPAGGGQIWTGPLGLAPNRKFVVAWVQVPHAQTTGGETLFTFQLVLHETGEIAFQYLDVQNGRSTLNSGRSASLGIEDPFGHVANSYSLNGSPSLVTNNQAILLAPQGSAVSGPTLRLNRAAVGSVSMTTYGQPGRRCVISVSPDARTWTALETNTLPASGILESTRPATEPYRFYNARLDP